MPRDASGLYTLVTGNPVIKGEPIVATWANPTLDDIAVALTQSLDRYGNGPMMAPLVLAGAPTDDDHAANKLYVDAKAWQEAPEDGLTYGRKNVAWVAIPPPLDAYTKAETDALYVNVAGDALTGPLLLHADPLNVLGAAPKQYVDARAWQEAPSDGQQYARRNAAWFAIPAPIDAYTKAETDTRYVNVTGDTMTGDLIVSKSGIAIIRASCTSGAAAVVAANAPIASECGLSLEKDGLTRWQWAANNTAESGGNNGSDLRLGRYSDTGVLLGIPIVVGRGSGQVTLSYPLKVAPTSGTTGAEFTAPASASCYVTYNTTSIMERMTVYKTNNVNRWSAGVDNIAETGSNAGSNWSITGWADNGAWLNNPLFISRSNGIVSMNNGVYIENNGTAAKIYAKGYGASRGYAMVAHASTAGTLDAIVFVNSAGGTSGRIVQSDTTISTANGSDYRMKEDCVPAVDVLDIIRAVPIYEGKYINDSEHQTRHYVIAHELQEQLPYAVFGEKDEMEEDGVTAKMQAVDYACLTPILWAAVQELLTRVEALEETF